MPENPISELDARDAARPAVRSFVVVPGDGVDLPVYARLLYIGGAGDVSLVCVNDPANHTGVTLHNVLAGTLLHVSARRVLASGTTATNIVGFA